MTPDCQVVDVVFTKSIIRSKASFTYEEAQARIDDPNRTDELTQSVRRLNELAKVCVQVFGAVRASIVFMIPPYRCPCVEDNFRFFEVRGAARGTQCNEGMRRAL